MSSGFVGAKGIADSVGNVPQTIEADVYIGVFSMEPIITRFNR